MSGGSNRTSLAPSPEDRILENPDSGWSANEDTKCTASRVKSVIKNIFAQLFSHAGLFLLVIGYSLMGAVIFVALEHDGVIKTKSEVQNLRKNTLDELYNLTGKIFIRMKEVHSDSSCCF